VVSAFSESSKKNAPKRILNTMVRLFISDEKIRASIRKEKSVADIRARFVKETTEDLGGIEMSQLGVDRRLHSFSKMRDKVKLRIWPLTEKSLSAHEPSC
jgi:hypothetical protein